MIRHNIFNVDRVGGDCFNRSPVTLDESTPRGLFTAGDGSRFIVCDHPRSRFAVALDEGKFPAFSLVPLGYQPIAYGVLCHFVQVHLGPVESFDLVEEEEDLGHGDIVIVHNCLMMGIAGPDERCTLETIAYGIGNVSGKIREWTLMAGGQIPFFGMVVAPESEQEDEPKGS
jgi:hypothetical protein